MKKKMAFTLPELVLTLGIIGVIAAMVVPTVYQNVYEAELYAAWKKQFSVVVKAWNMVVYENGQTAVNIYNNDKELMNALKAKLNIMNDCLKDSTKICWATNTKYFNNTAFSGTNPAFALADGSFWGYRSGFQKNCSNTSADMKDICLNLVVDVNGSKGPNMMGKDIYGVHLRAKQAAPFGSEGDNVSGPSSDCKKGGTGWACSTQNLFKTNSQE